MINPCPGEPGQGTQVDMALVEVVMAGDEARQHAGIGRVRVAADQGEAHAGDRFHAEPFQHRDVAVAAADEHEILDNGGLVVLHGGILTCFNSAASIACGNRRVKRC